MIFYLITPKIMKMAVRIIWIFNRLNYEFGVRWRIIISDAMPTLRLSGCEVGFISPRTVPTQVKCKNPH